MAYTQTDLDTLRATMARGLRRARINGEEVEFTSLAEMERLEQKMKRELGQGRTRRVAKIETSNGWR